MIEGKRNNKYCYHFVNDTPVALATIFRLANQNDYKYTTKLFKATNLKLSEYQEKNEKMFGTIFVIAEKDILDLIDNDRIYYRDEFSIVVDELLKRGYSVVNVTINGHGIVVDPKNNSNKLTKLDIMVDDSTSNIDCYLYDDELSLAVEQFVNYINTHGGNIRGINEKMLLNEILEENKKNK